EHGFETRLIEERGPQGAAGHADACDKARSRTGARRFEGRYVPILQESERNLTELDSFFHHDRVLRPWDDEELGVTEETGCCARRLYGDDRVTISDDDG